MKVMDRTCRLCHTSFLYIHRGGRPIEYCAECRRVRWNPRRGAARKSVAA